MEFKLRPKIDDDHIETTVYESIQLFSCDHLFTLTIEYIVPRLIRSMRDFCAH